MVLSSEGMSGVELVVELVEGAGFEGEGSEGAGISEGVDVCEGGKRELLRSREGWKGWIRRWSARRACRGLRVVWIRR